MLNPTEKHMPQLTCIVTSLPHKRKVEVGITIESLGVVKMNSSGEIKCSLATCLAISLEFPTAGSLRGLQLLFRKMGTVVLSTLLLLFKVSFS